MEIIELIAEGDTVAGHFTCSATHTGTRLGHPPTGRFERVDEVGIYRLATQRSPTPGRSKTTSPAFGTSG
jgi:predicted ester cyclase